MSTAENPVAVAAAAEPYVSERQWFAYGADYGYSQEIVDLERRIDAGAVEVTLEGLLALSDPPHAYFEHIMLKSHDGWFLGRFDTGGGDAGNGCRRPGQASRLCRRVREVATPHDPQLIDPTGTAAMLHEPVSTL